MHDKPLSVVQQKLELTPVGDQVFQQVFPAYIAHIKQRFDQLDLLDLELLKVLLTRLRQSFQD